MVGRWVKQPPLLPPAHPTQLHLALPAPGVAGVTVPHPHALEGVIGDFPLMPDAEEQSISLG